MDYKIEKISVVMTDEAEVFNTLHIFNFTCYAFTDKEKFGVYTAQVIYHKESWGLSYENSIVNPVDDLADELPYKVQRALSEMCRQHADLLK